MGSETVMGKFVLVICICAIVAACNVDPIPSNKVTRCNRVYILVDNAMKREYQRFVPRAQDWAYYVTEYGFKSGNTEHVYRYDHNIFINRRKDEVKNKIVTEATYFASCGEGRGRADTIFLMVDIGDKYSEYLVKERYDLIKDGESVVISNIFGDSELLVDFSMSQGQWSPLDSTMRRIVTRKVSNVDCNLIHQVTRFHKLDSVNESFVKGIGSMHRRTPNLDIRLKLINDMTIAAYLDEACE
jgi:hypothetical protein